MNAGAPIARPCSLAMGSGSLKFVHIFDFLLFKTSIGKGLLQASPLVSAFTDRLTDGFYACSIRISLFRRNDSLPVFICCFHCISPRNKIVVERGPA